MRDRSRQESCTHGPRIPYRVADTGIATATPVIAPAVMVRIAVPPRRHRVLNRIPLASHRDAFQNDAINLQPCAPLRAQGRLVRHVPARLRNGSFETPRHFLDFLEYDMLGRRENGRPRKAIRAPETKALDTFAEADPSQGQSPGRAASADGGARAHHGGRWRGMRFCRHGGRRRNLYRARRCRHGDPE